MITEAQLEHAVKIAKNASGMSLELRNQSRGWSIESPYGRVGAIGTAHEIYNMTTALIDLARYMTLMHKEMRAQEEERERHENSGR